SPGSTIFILPESLAQATNPYYSGGELSAQTHLTQYFASHAASDYKNTRDALQGENFSTQFSPYLAHGAVSVRQIMCVLGDYEDSRGASESTYWIYFELLWREYFYWYACKYRQRLFLFSGIAQQKPLLEFFDQRFASWCQGKTQFPLV